MSYWQDPDSNPMSDEQADALVASIKEILGVDIGVRQLEEICDILYFGYPSIVERNLDEERFQRDIQEYIQLAKLHGCTFEEIIEKCRADYRENLGCEVDPETEVFYQAMIDYRREHPEIYGE